MNLHHRAYGEGPVLVVLHGLFGSLNNWHTFATRLADRFRILAVDQRNHGASPHSPVFNYLSMAGDLKELLDRHSISRASVLGHSMGGKTALQFAALYPDSIDRLIVADIAPRAYARGHDSILDALVSVDPSSASSRRDVDAVIARFVPNPAVRQFLLTNLQRDPDGRFRWKINIPAIRENYDAIIGPVEIPSPILRPVLFIRGGRSPYLTDEDIAAIRPLFPFAVVTTLRSAGHWVHADAPDEFRQAVASFLAG